jgi:hypothetical protein
MAPVEDIGHLRSSKRSPISRSQTGVLCITHNERILQMGERIIMV